MSEPMNKSEFVSRLAKAQVFDPDHSMSLAHTCPGCGAGAALRETHPRTGRHLCVACSALMKQIQHSHAAEVLEACRGNGRLEIRDGIYAMGVLGVSDEDGPYTVAVEIQDGVIVDVLPVDTLDVDADTDDQQ